MSTPILETLLPKVREHGRSQAAAFCQGDTSFGGSAWGEIESFLGTLGVSYDALTSADQDRIYDEYLEGVKSEMARRLTPSDPVPVAGHYTVSDGKILSDADGRQYQTRIYTPESLAAASGVIPSPSVPDAVKIAQKALESYQKALAALFMGLYRCDEGVAEGLLMAQSIGASALSALRLLTAESEVVSPEGVRPPASGLDSSSADVPPVCTFCNGRGGWEGGLAGEVWHECTECNGVDPGFNSSQTVTSGASVPQGGHANSGQSKAVASKEPSSEDKELLDWLEAQEDFSLSSCDLPPRYEGATWEMGFNLETPEGAGVKSVKDNRLRDVLRTAKAQASTTPQKGGQGV